MEQKIFLQSFNSKKSVNTSEGLNTHLFGKRKLLPTNDYGSVINQYEQYTKEREKCNIIRLTCQVNPICSNVLFNDITEVVKYEGSDDVSFLNYGIGSKLSKDLQKVECKTNSETFWTGGTVNGEKSAFQSKNFFINPIRDTQLSNNECGFVYHCGLDILNNHLLRTQSFKCICPTENNTEYIDFNTMGDKMRTVKGEQVIDYIYYPGTANENTHLVKFHLYQYDDILSFSDTKSQRLIKKYNGWIGFVNKSKLKTYKEFQDSQILEIERPIMYKNGGDFIDMYPSRDLYSFVPKYNSYKHRIEKNWAYAITYPSSSTTDGFETIFETNNNINAPKAIYYDENTKSDNGTTQLVIYSIIKHGLKEGDYVNIYKTYTSANTNTKVTEKVLNSVEVTNVVDDFIFTVANNGLQISNAWVYLSDTDLNASSITITISGTDKTYLIDGNYHKYYYSGTSVDKKYYITNSQYVNFDDSALNISYKKVTNDIECDYYARIFSRLPNFKWASDDTSSEYEIYKNNGQTLKKYQDFKYEFENHISRLAFAKNIYSDDIGELVFTDDMDISNLHDNLGRPLSSLYITFFKNNKGYKEWYGDLVYKNWSEKTINEENDEIEFSHCFGRLMCGIECSDESKYNEKLPNIHKINSESLEGLDVDKINSTERDYNDSCKADNSEIIYWNDTNFYGDICCYDNYNALETILQPILYRFNTAQRECSINANDHFLTFGYDEITTDDYDKSSDEYYAITTKAYSEKSNKKFEGYYYQPSYEIPIKTFDVLQSMMPDMLTIKKFSPKEITTLTYHYLTVGDKAMLYDSKNEKYYTLVTIKGENDNYRTFSYKAYDENDNEIQLIGLEKANLKLFKLDNMDIPSYARLLKDGTCRYIWRNIVNNGMSSDDTVETYPFTNGAFYINKRIDIYVRRQDPYGEYDLYDSTDIPGNEMDSTTENNYVTDDEITC